MFDPLLKCKDLIIVQNQERKLQNLQAGCNLAQVLETIVADPGCLSRIRIFSIPDPGSKRFPDPGSGFASEFKYFNPKISFFSKI
jgi:hypothetical protein